MRLNLYRIDGGYFVCPADSPIPSSHAGELVGRKPDMTFLSRETAGRRFMEEHMRNNGAAVLDPRVADIMLAGYAPWSERTF